MGSTTTSAFSGRSGMTGRTGRTSGTRKSNLSINHFSINLNKAKEDKSIKTLDMVTNFLRPVGSFKTKILLTSDDQRDIRVIGFDFMITPKPSFSIL